MDERVRLMVHWICPVVRRNTLVWLDTCESALHTHEAIEWHKAHKLPPICSNMAKINFHGRKLCVRHARMAALDALAGEMPEFNFPDSASESQT
jgi:hypothetical protein